MATALNAPYVVSIIAGELLFASIGYRLTRKRPRPRWPVLGVLIVVTLLMWSIGSDVRIISAFGYCIYVNHALQGLSMGAVLGYLVAKGVVPAVESAEAGGK